jgi:cystathionine gamma-synthase
MKFDSQVVHGTGKCDPATGSICVPIYQTTTYKHPSLTESCGYDYSRIQNPTRQALEETIAMLEEGTHGFAYTTGLAADMAVFSLLSAGDHAVISDDVYGGTYRMIEKIWSRYKVEFTFVDPGNLDAIEAAMRPNTKLVFVETPTNPTMKVADIAAIAKIAKAHGAYTVVDNTFLTPYLQKPLNLGADIVLHSATKFLGGHHDTMAGLIVVKDPELAEHFKLMVGTEGAGLAPLDSWLILRGIKTLALRMQRHEENTRKVAEWLRNHPRVEKVYYVGFPDHPGYEISSRQASGFGGMLSFTVDSVETVHRVIENVKMIMFAESLGGTETLITYPLTQTHASVPEEARLKLGITDRFMRLSVGIEDVQDIIDDLAQALN